MTAWHTRPFDTCIPALGWSAGWSQPGPPRLGEPGRVGLALCCAVVDMETLQLSVCRVPGSGVLVPIWWWGEAGAGGWEHKSRAVRSSRHDRPQGQGQQDHQFPVLRTQTVSPTGCPRG